MLMMSMMSMMPVMSMMSVMSMLFENMFFLFFICVLLGWFLGILTGMIPGIHVNNIAAVLVGMLPVFTAAGFSPLSVCLLILSCAVSHTFHNIIPAIFLGVPSEDTALAVLPGHRLLLMGQGLAAIRLSALASAGSVLLSLIFIIPMALFLFCAYPILEPHMGFILIAISLLIILSERPLSKIMPAAFVFLCAGMLGYFAFGLDGQLNPLLFSADASVLMPLLSGLFGLPLLIVSLFQKSEIPTIREHIDMFPKSLFLKNTIIGTLAGAFVSWIPGVSSSVAAILAGVFTGKSKGRKDEDTDEMNEDDEEDEENNAKEFIVTVSAISTANAVFGLLAFFVIGKSRNGAVVSIKDILSASDIIVQTGVMSGDTFSLFLLFYAVIVLTGFLSYFSTLDLGKIVPRLLSRLNYKLISGFVIALLVVLTLLLTGIYGFILFLASVFVGFLPVLLKTRKSALMGVILFPVMLYFLGLR